MMNMPVTVHTTKLRFLKRNRGITGSFARRSTSAKTTAIAANSANRPTICHESHGNNVPPHAVASTSDDTDTAIAIMPSTSTDGCLARRAGRLEKNATAAMARSASGMLKANSQRHPVTCTNHPPKSGPTTVDTANTEPKTPMYLPRCRGGMMSAMVACERMMSPPPPKPSTARPAMRPSMLGASPHVADPTMKTESATMNKCLRPNRSPSLP